ncbi:MAG: hypothetical protein K9G60_10895 [Pseudolabrys sp.]|nr:hypothetical protein [Pseudolabrys sp.]
MTTFLLSIAAVFGLSLLVVVVMALRAPLLDDTAFVSRIAGSKAIRKVRGRRSPIAPV